MQIQLIFKRLFLVLKQSEKNLHNKKKTLNSEDVKNKITTFIYIFLKTQRKTQLGNIPASLSTLSEAITHFHPNKLTQS